MRVVIDGLPIRGDNSLSIVSAHLLAAWEQLGTDDEIHLVVRAGASIAIPDSGSITVHEVSFGRLPLISRIRAQNVVLPRLCRSLRADVLFAILPNTAVTPVPCPRAVMAWDFRYRLRPEQFSRKTLTLRRASYAVGFRQADGVACISGRTRRDLLALHPRLATVPVRVTHLGADHVDEWTTTTQTGAPTSPKPYAIAFGHFGNKNVELVLRAWAELRRRGTDSVLPLRIVGVSERDRAALRAQVAQADLSELVSISPWLPGHGFQEQFASSSLVVFPSDFEGFGLPAVEALRLGIPVVITPDPALLEVTGGHATVVEGDGPKALARAVERARSITPESIAAGRQHAATFTWASCARSVRAWLAEVTALAQLPVAPRHRRIPIPARLGAAIAAGLLVIGGATAVSFALGSSSSHPPPAVPTTTTVPRASGDRTQAPASSTGGTSPTAASSSRDAGGGSSGRDSGSNAAPSSGSGVVTRSSTTATTSSPPVTVPQMPTPSVTVPSVTVPPVTVPTAVCPTMTTVPCAVTVPGQS